MPAGIWQLVQAPHAEPEPFRGPLQGALVLQLHTCTEGSPSARGYRLQIHPLSLWLHLQVWRVHTFQPQWEWKWSGDRGPSCSSSRFKQRDHRGSKHPEERDRRLARLVRPHLQPDLHRSQRKVQGEESSAVHVTQGKHVQQPRGAQIRRCQCCQVQQQQFAVCYLAPPAECMPCALRRWLDLRRASVRTTWRACEGGALQSWDSTSCWETALCYKTLSFAIASKQLILLNLHLWWTNTPAPYYQTSGHNKIFFIYIFLCK